VARAKELFDCVCAKAETHAVYMPKSVVNAMMLRMGYQVGRGLGAALGGILAPPPHRTERIEGERHFWPMLGLGAEPPTRAERDFGLQERRAQAAETASGQAAGSEEFDEGTRTLERMVRMQRIRSEFATAFGTAREGEAKRSLDDYRKMTPSP